MKRLLAILPIAILLVMASGVGPAGLPLRAQNRLVSLSGQGTGHVALGMAIRRLNSVGTFLQTDAHPDDENNALLAWLTRGLGMRAAVLTLTRGNGGQNEIGPELFEDLAVVRTEELLSAHRLDGAEQFPEEIRAGLRPWQPKKLYFGGGPPPGSMGAAPAAGARPGAPRPPAAAADTRFVAVDANVYDPLLGRTFNEIGAEARSYHKCQGTGQIVPLPGPAAARYVLGDTVIPGQGDKTENWLFDGVDTSIAGLARYARGTAPDELTSGLAAIAE